MTDHGTANPTDDSGEDDDDEKEGDNDNKIGIKTQLRAANGTLYPSEGVFVAAFKHLGGIAKRFLRKRSIKAKKSEIQWILTVPAIWNDTAKDMMRKWIIKAGLVSDDDPNQCKIVYEPDCASLAIQHEIRDRVNDDDFKSNGTTNVSLKKGDKYVLVDAGGGTVDIACHEILGEFGVKEVLPPSGGPWGSFYIDEVYKELLDDIFGEFKKSPNMDEFKVMDEFKKSHPGAYIEAIHHFQRAKQQFGVYQDNHHNCRLPDDFVAWLEEQHEDEENTLDIEQIAAKVAPEKIRLNGETLEIAANDEELQISGIGRGIIVFSGEGWQI